MNKIKKRQGYKVIILDPARTWIAEDKCAGCGKIKEDWTRRKDWICCSKKCTKKHHKETIHFGWQDIRNKIMERDLYVCQSCGASPKKEFSSTPWSFEVFYSDVYRSCCVLLKKYKFSDGDSGLLYRGPARSQLVGDHIVPIALGGDEWAFDNIQTLCIACHKIKTKEDVKQIAILRKKLALKEKGQEVLCDG